MEHQSLYRRFRSQRFAELVGQEHVTEPLRAAVRDHRTSHAYLFSGPRGTGKTSTARILAKALNCAQPLDGEPCDECESCVQIREGRSFDVFELDAASNSGVEAMRDLTARAALTTPGRWKVYIVDEVHMLSTAAANALLKTLEEPPPHVVFVLATTDPQKVLPTIRSRTQHYSFRLLSTDALVAHLQTVASTAGLDVDGDTVALAARRGQGSARDALSSLEQLSLAPAASLDHADTTQLLMALASDNRVELLRGVAALIAAGHDPRSVTRELVGELRECFLADLAPELCGLPGSGVDSAAHWARNYTLRRTVAAIEALGRALIDMREALDARAVLEVALLGLTITQPAPSTPAPAPERVATPDPRPARPSPTPQSQDAPRQAPIASRSATPTESTAPGALRGAPARPGTRGAPPRTTQTQPPTRPETRTVPTPEAATPDPHLLTLTRENLTLSWPQIVAGLGATKGRLGDGYWSNANNTTIEWTVNGPHGINDGLCKNVAQAVAKHFFGAGGQGRLTMTVLDATGAGASPSASTYGRNGNAGDSMPSSADSSSTDRDYPDEDLSREDLGQPLTQKSQIDRLQAVFPGAEVLPVADNGGNGAAGRQQEVQT